MSLICECLALKNPRRGKQAPAIRESGLAGRKARLLDRNNPVVVKNQPMNQVNLVRSFLQAAPRYSNSLQPDAVALAEYFVTMNPSESLRFFDMLRNRNSVFRNLDLGDSPERKKQLD